MAQNFKPITCPVTPNRGVNSYAPSWLTSCTDSTTNTTNPSLNSILDTIDLYAQSKAFVTISHSCNSDFTAVAGSEHLAFEEAIAYATSGTKPRAVLAIPDQPYILNTPITIPSASVTLLGQHTTIEFGGGVAISLYQASDFFMSGFIFNGTAYPISATSCTTLTFRDLTFINTGQKIFSVHGCSEVQISNCISNSSEGVLLVDANSYNLNISDSTFKGIQGTAFVSNDSKFINIIDNQIEMGGANVGSRLMTSTNGYGNSFRGNTYYDGKPSTGFSPIYLLNHSGYRLIGNYLADSSPTVYTAVEKSNSYSCIFSSNTFFGYDATSGSINGLDVTDSAIGNVF
jgi:hypothetical protein